MRPTPGLVGGTAALAFIGLAAGLPRLVGVDAAVWTSVLGWRGCGTDACVQRMVDVATWALLGCLMLALAATWRAGAPRRAWAALMVAALGLLANTTMKTLFLRPRPSNLPDIAIGHSFPSGHVMNSVLAALLVMALARALPGRRCWGVVAIVLALVTSSGRVLVADHWLLDTVGATLAAIALQQLCFGSFVRRPLVAPAAAFLACLAVLAAASRWPITLPSPHVALGRDTVTVDLGAPAATAALTGAWEAPRVEEPAGTIVWLDGSGEVAIDLPDVPPGRPGMVALAGRPESAATECLRVLVTLDDAPVGAFVPYRGWREYRLAVPPERLGGGRRRLGIAVETATGAPARFAVSYVSIAVEGLRR